MVPLITVVGFLGAGKTTFLKEIVPLLAQRGVKSHVIINDFQNARVDAHYFKDLAQEIVPINGSCVCCGSFEELIQVLEKFEVAENSIVLMESNGVTDSINLIENLSLRKECRRYTKPLQISIVDTKFWQKRHWHDELEYEQVTTASFVYLTKTKNCSKERVHEVLEDVKAKSPYGCVIDQEGIINELVEVAHGKRQEILHQNTSDKKKEQDSHNHSKYHFSSWEHALPHSVEQRFFYNKLQDLPEQVIRAKGIVRIKDQSNQKFIFQKVAEEIVVIPISEEHELNPLIICIGSGLPIPELEMLFGF